MMPLHELAAFGNTERRWAHVEELLLAAAKCLAKGHIDSAAWRIADAGGMLAKKVKALGMEGVPGVHEHTGMGCKLVPADSAKAFKKVRK